MTLHSNLKNNTWGDKPTALQRKQSEAFNSLRVVLDQTRAKSRVNTVSSGIKHVGTDDDVTLCLLGVLLQFIMFSFCLVLTYFWSHSLYSLCIVYLLDFSSGVKLLFKAAQLYSCICNSDLL